MAQLQSLQETAVHHNWAWQSWTRATIIVEAAKRLILTHEELQGSLAKLGESAVRITISRALHKIALYGRVESGSVKKKIMFAVCENMSRGYKNVQEGALVSWTQHLTFKHRAKHFRRIKMILKTISRVWNMVVAESCCWDAFFFLVGTLKLILTWKEVKKKKRKIKRANLFVKQDLRSVSGFTI